jgi:hypothetical protein
LWLSEFRVYDTVRTVQAASGNATDYDDTTLGERRQWGKAKVFDMTEMMM